jgi:hypothetical protein
MDDLIVVGNVNAMALFTNGDSLQNLLEDIKKKALDHVPDVKTDKGRKDIASIAYKVSQSKTLLDGARKELVNEWKTKAKSVDKEGKKARDFLDNLRDEIKKPLIDWQKAEEEKTKKEYALAEYEQAWDKALVEHDLFLRSKVIEEKEAKIAKAEAQRIEKENQARQIKEAAERDERLKKEAIKEAEEKAKQREIEAEKRLQKEVEAREKAESDRIKEKAREKLEREQAVKEAKEDAERKARKEKEDAKKIEEKMAEAERVKASNKTHQKTINNKVIKALVTCGIPDDIAKDLIVLVASHKIQNMIIEY